MLVFIDESGDTGLKKPESSRFFIMTLALFDENEVALDCDKMIDFLRKELNLPENYEFHFGNNSERVRREFLKAIKSYSFFYFAVVV